MCLFFNRLFFQRPCLQLPLCWPYYCTGHHYTKMLKRMRELWLAQTAAQLQFDELLAHTSVPDGYDQARYEGSGLSSHLRLHLAKIKQEKLNKCCRWLGSTSRCLIGLTFKFLLQFKPSSSLKKVQIDGQSKRNSSQKPLRLLPSPRYTFSSVTL